MSIRPPSRRIRTQNSFAINTAKTHHLKTQPASCLHPLAQTFSTILRSNRPNSSAKPSTTYQQPHSLKVSLINKLQQRSSVKKPVRTVTENEEQEQNSSKYCIDQLIAKGTSSAVYSAHCHHNRKYCIKKIALAPNQDHKQLKILKTLSHPNIIQIVDYYYSSHKDIVDLHIVTPLYSATLHQMMKDKKIKKQNVPFYLYQILSGLLYLQEQNIVHCNINPNNILVNSKTHDLVISGFSSATFDCGFNYNPIKRCPRIYKAPQLIFGSNSHLFPVDVWSFGCILVEIVTGTTLFKSKSSIEQILQILKQLGKPSQQQMAMMNPEYKMSDFQILPNLKSKLMKDIVNTRDPLALDLMEKIFMYNPELRITAEQAMNHPFFYDFKKSQQFQELSAQKTKQNQKIKEESQKYEHSETKSIVMPDTPVSKLRTLKTEQTALSSKVNSTLKSTRRNIKLTYSRTLTMFQ